MYSSSGVQPLTLCFWTSRSMIQSSEMLSGTAPSTAWSVTCWGWWPAGPSSAMSGTCQPCINRCVSLVLKHASTCVHNVSWVSFIPKWQEGEDAVQFANRVKSAIAHQGGLVDLQWWDLASSHSSINYFSAAAYFSFLLPGNRLKFPGIIIGIAQIKRVCPGLSVQGRWPEESKSKGVF